MRIKYKKTEDNETNIFWVTMTDLMTALVLVFMILFFYTYMTSFYEKIEQTTYQQTAFRALQSSLSKQNIQVEIEEKQSPDNNEINKNINNNTQKQNNKDNKPIKKETISKKVLSFIGLGKGKGKGKGNGIKNTKPNKNTTASSKKVSPPQMQTQKAGITIDANSGVVKISDLELFDLNSYELSDKGKKYLSAFAPAYIDSLFSNEYLKDHIDKIIIQGHTDSQTYKGEYTADQQYMKNMELSLKRAYTVAEFITNTPYNKINGNKLRKMVIVEGASYSNPVMNSSGKEDYAKSRRVELKIVMKESNKYKDAIKSLASDKHD